MMTKVAALVSVVGGAAQLIWQVKLAKDNVWAHPRVLQLDATATADRFDDELVHLIYAKKLKIFMRWQETHVCTNSNLLSLGSFHMPS